MYVPGGEGGEPVLIIVRVDEQKPDHAEGEIEDQSGDLPAILNEEGEAPELEDFDPEAAEAPEEVESEVLIQGEGEEIGPYDHLVMRYTGWRWSDGEVFDSAWPGVQPAPPEGEEQPEGQESPEEDEDQVVPPMDSPLPQLIPGWAEALEGVEVGSRVAMVIPPEQAYGESEEEDGESSDEDGSDDDGGSGVEPQTAEGEPAPEDIEDMDMEEIEEMLGGQQGEHPLAGETLIFVVDVIAAVPASDEQVEQMEQQQQQLDEAEEQDGQEESGEEETGEQPQGQEN
nr:FKBP-type peptidyl-prolyl cis-trans isomerase [Nesterenkonia lacusekhoensis]